jgi:hypothetical protein
MAVSGTGGPGSSTATRPRFSGVAAIAGAGRASVTGAGQVDNARMLQPPTKADVLERAAERNARMVGVCRKLIAQLHQAEGHQATRWTDCSADVCRMAYRAIERNEG